MKLYIISTAVTLLLDSVTTCIYQDLLIYLLGFREILVSYM